MGNPPAKVKHFILLLSVFAASSMTDCANLSSHTRFLYIEPKNQAAQQLYIYTPFA